MFVSLAALALAAIVLAHWSWVWFGPRTTPQATVSPGVEHRPERAKRLFGVAQKSAGTMASTGLAIKLLGVIAADRDREGYAVIQIEPRETVAVRENENVVPGVRVVEVLPDRVILERDGQRETLTWPPKPSAPNPVKPARTR